MSLLLEEITQITVKGKPFLKWAGGKMQIIPELEKRLPISIKSQKYIEKYFELFVGGGAFFFFLKNNYEVGHSYLYDINRELVVGYKVIQTNPYELIDELNNLSNRYLYKSSHEQQIFFYEIRENYNKQIPYFDYNHYDKDWIIRASWLIFLNKTCFNGLYRQNKSGEFNVPFGGYINPKICATENILQVSKMLSNTNIYCSDFTEAERFIDNNSFVYLDPPYRPLNKTSSFTDYSKEGFTDDDQIRLAEFYKWLDKKGVLLMLSNSDSQDNFFQDLYHGFNIEKVMANRMINCNSSGRGKIPELIITNH